MKKIQLPQNDEDLLQECKISAFRSQGSGGQHVNTTDSAVRLTHLPTGLTVTSQKERSQYLNKKECLQKLKKLVERLNYRKPKRKPTKIPRAVKEDNRKKKFKHSLKKTLRQKPNRENT